MLGLLKIDGLIDWKPLQKELSKLYHPSLGRPSYPPLVMFKALLLQQWYKDEFGKGYVGKAFYQRLNEGNILRENREGNLPPFPEMVSFNPHFNLQA